jgi:hypothetical protein
MNDELADHIEFNACLSVHRSSLTAAGSLGLNYKWVMRLSLIFVLVFCSFLGKGQYLGGVGDGFVFISTNPLAIGITTMYQGGSGDGFVKVNANGVSLGSASLARVNNIAISDLEKDLMTLGERETSGVYIYPNPVHSKFTLIIDQRDGDNNIVSLIDTNGKLVMKSTLHEQQVEFDVQSLSPGTYLLRVKTATDNVKIIRITITH